VIAQQTPTQATAPGPRGLPIIGNVLEMGGNNTLERYMLMRQKYGDLVGVKLGPMHGFIVFNPEDVYYVLVKNQKNYIKGIGYDSFRLLVGNGLVTSDGALWRQQRRLMQPPFTPASIGQYADMMVDVTKTLLDGWQALADRGGTFEMDAAMRQLTMSIIGRAMFSIDLSAEMTEVGDALEEAFGFIPTRTNSVVPLALPLPAHRRFKDNLRIINAFVDERIAEGRHNPDQNNLLGLLLRARDEETGAMMDAQQLRDEVITLFFAGFETTARSLTWGWYMLTRHLDAQQKIQAEVDAVLGARLPAIDDLFALNYTRQVVDETLRLYPPTALLARQNSEADTIGGYTIPAGSLIILVPYFVHRHPSVWEDAERFDPDRFAAGANEARARSAYIPFAAGPRVCLGNNFALLEMVYAMAMTAQRYTITAATGEEIAHEFAGTIRPVKPLIVKIENRRKAETA
jgi:cytochrome P450